MSDTSSRPPRRASEIPEPVGQDAVPPVPSAYETGWVEFFYRRFRSDRRALVPRFETESLVREILRTLREEPYATLVDVGTGSGVIAVSVGAEAPFGRIVGLDVSGTALSLASENARANGVSAEWVESDLLEALRSGRTRTPEPESGVFFVANLPYVRDGDPNVSPDTAHEPPEALYGGAGTGFETTLRFLREFEAFAAAFPNGRFRVACEVGHDHLPQIEAFARESGRDVRTFADPFGIPRFFTYRIWPEKT